MRKKVTTTIAIRMTSPMVLLIFDLKCQASFISVLTAHIRRAMSRSPSRRFSDCAAARLAGYRDRAIQSRM